MLVGGGCFIAPVFYFKSSHLQATFLTYVHLYVIGITKKLLSAGRHIIQFTLIYNKYKGKVYNYVHKMVNDIMLAEDIVQTVFMKLYENIKRINELDKIEFWIFKTARNEIFMHYRQKKTHVDKYGVLDSSELKIADESNTLDNLERKEIKSIVLNILNTLPDEQKEVFMLKEYGGMSYKEIAELTGTDPNLVKSRLYKTRQKIFNELSKIYEL